MSRSTRRHSLLVTLGAVGLLARAEGELSFHRPLSATSMEELLGNPGIRFVSPVGKPENPGSLAAPWDFASAVEGRQPVSPGTTIYVLGGTYRHPDRSATSAGFSIRLAGTAEKPVHLAALPGARATIDGYAQVVAPADYLYLWNLEFTTAETIGWDRRSASGGGPLPDHPYVPGGLNITAGRGCHYIHLNVHHNPGTGIGFWRNATDSGIHGCLIHHNGSIGPDRYHGPGIYTQNQTGEKQITDCLIFANYSTTIQAYGSSNAWVDHYRIAGNIAYAPVKEGGRQRILVGCGRPSVDCEVSNNLCHEVPIQVGYTAEAARLSRQIRVTNNVVLRGDLSLQVPPEHLTATGNRVWNEKDPLPTQAEVHLHPSRLDPDRAHLAIVNWARQEQVTAEIGSFLRNGEPFRVQDPADVYGPPVVKGVVQQGRITLPVKGEFAAYVLLRVNPEQEAFWRAVAKKGE